MVLWVFAAIGLAQAGATELLDVRTGACLLVVALCFIHATTLNDIADEGIDRINIPQARGRPLLSGDASRGELVAVGTMCAAAAIGVASTLGVRVVAVVIAGLGLNCAYSLRPVRLSDRGLLTALLLPLGYTALPFLIGALSAGGGLTPRASAILAAIYVAFIGRGLLKDFRDVRGDAAHGKRTFLLRHGRRATCALSAGCWCAGGALSLLVVPLASPAALAFAVYIGCALHGLARLSRPSGDVPDQVIVGGIARTGGAMALTLLAAVTMAERATPPAQQALVIGALLVFGVGTYLTALADTRRVTAINPY